jgi:hypothetical protein
VTLLPRLPAELADVIGRLRAAIGLGPPPPPTALDWPRWLEVVHEHDLAPFLHARHERVGSPVPTAIADELAADYTRWAHTTLFRAGELAAVVDALGDVTAVALKGSALAGTLYDEAAERVMSDLDLLIDGPAARDRAVDRLALRGYHVRFPDAVPDHDLALWGPVQELEIDLHVNFTRPALPAAAMADAWASRVTTGALGGRLTVLDAGWRALHAALHALSDPIDSPLLRNLFEVGWMARELSAAERDELVERARRYGVADRVARAFGLAHRLFGTPPLFALPRLSAWELWSWQRLSWRYGDDDARGRFVQHLAEYHLRRLHTSGRSGLDPRPLVATAAETAAGILAGHVETWSQRWLTPWIERVRGGAAAGLRRAPADAVAVGDGLLVHDAAGDVHLLDADAAQAWTAAAGDTTADAIVARLVTAGMPSARATAAVDALVEQSLLIDP